MGMYSSKLQKAQATITNCSLYVDGRSFTSKRIDNETGIRDISITNSALAVLSRKKLVEESSRSRQNGQILWRRRMANPMLRLPWTTKGMQNEFN